ncbi:MAG: hypothetical protein HPY66_2789 [Firmicutes bacterium]|nr:hypothetical protein [Bacillota bacterium]
MGFLPTAKWVKMICEVHPMYQIIRKLVESVKAVDVLAYFWF